MSWRCNDLFNSVCTNVEQLQAVLPKVKDLHLLYCCSQLRTVFFIYTTNYHRSDNNVDTDDDTDTDSDCGSVCSAHYSKVVLEDVARKDAIKLLEKIGEELCSDFMTGAANEVVVTVSKIEEIVDTTVAFVDTPER